MWMEPSLLGRVREQCRPGRFKLVEQPRSGYQNSHYSSRCNGRNCSNSRPRGSGCPPDRPYRYCDRCHNIDGDLRGHNGCNRRNDYCERSIHLGSCRSILGCRYCGGRLLAVWSKSRGVRFRKSGEYCQQRSRYGGNLSSHFLTTNHISDIARGFTGYSGNTADAMSLISDTLDTGSFNEARSSVDPLRLVFEKVYAGGSGQLGLRAVWDVVSQELWTAYPFPVVD